MSKDHGKEIGDIFKKAFQSGDLSRLKDLGPAVQDAVRDIPGVTLETRNSAPPAPRPAGGQPAASPAQVRPMWQGQAPRGHVVPKLPKGTALIALGCMGTVVFGLGATVFGTLSAVVSMAQGVFLPLSIAFFALAVACCPLLGAGFSKRKLGQSAEAYYALFQQKKVYTFDELAATLGKTPKQIKKEIRRARAKGLMPDMRTDADETCVMQGEEAYHLYLESETTRRRQLAEQDERERRAKDPATAPLEAFRLEGESTIRKIRQANDAIPGEEISAKLEQLEAATGRIVAHVQKHPDKLPDTRKFMDYYLPTTLKLVETYRQYEELDVQPENVRVAKREIENALDTINLAFTNLFESLHEHDTLDVSTDIAVLEKMLEQEGLTGKQFDINN